MKYLIAISLLAFSSLGIAQENDTSKEHFVLEIPILWKTISSADYGFHQEWSYPEGVYINQWGQVSCDGICPTEIDVMKDDQGRIYDDSLESFYQIIDTTHLPHTIRCSNMSMYEFAGTDIIHFTGSGGQFIGETEVNAATHSTLYIQIKDAMCSAWVRYVSILPDRPEMFFYMEYGRIILDPIAYEQGIIKGFFDFRFSNELEPSVPLIWSGFLYAPIED